MYSDREGTDKNHPGQNLPDKTPGKIPLGQNVRELRHMYMYVCM